jgi:hypothetical protein
MKPIRKEYPSIRAYVKSGQTYFRVDLRRKHHIGPKTKQFTDRQTAIEFAQGIGDQATKEGLNSIAKHGTDARIAVWEEQLGVFGRTVEEAMELALKHYTAEKTKMETPFVGELVTVWIDDKITNPLKPLRKRSIESIRAMGALFKTDFGIKRVAEISPAFVDTYIKGKDVSNQTRQNIMAYLSQFFNWCIKKNYTTVKNPTVGIEIEVANGLPKFYTVEQCTEIMKAVLKDTQVTPYFLYACSLV